MIGFVRVYLIFWVDDLLLNRWFMEFVFKNNKTGESKTVVISESEIRSEMEHMAWERLCDCKPNLGETNVIECECEEFYEDFDLEK